MNLSISRRRLLKIGAGLGAAARGWPAPEEGQGRMVCDCLRVGPLGPTPARTTDAFPLSDQSNQGGWKRYEPMSDEFDGEELDKSKWYDFNPSWQGRQPGFFLPANVSVSAGQLHLTMRKQEVPEMPKDKGYHTYTCATVKSKGLVLYGCFEVRARPMNSAGSSSFWFNNHAAEEWTEIDVFEIGGAAKGFEYRYNTNLHVFYSPTVSKHTSKPGTWTAPWRLADDFHVYGLEWDADQIQFFVDGVVVRRVRNTSWHQPLALIFDSETMPNWLGLPEDKDLPSTYSIDYVRAWRK